MLNFNAFTLRALNDLLTVITVSKRGGITDVVDLESAVLNAIENKRPRDRRPPATVRAENLRKSKSEDPAYIRCKICNQWARTLEVNTKSNNQVDGDYKACSLCYNPDCMNTEFYKETVQELRKKNEDRK